MLENVAKKLTSENNSNGRKYNRQHVGLYALTLYVYR